MPRSSKILDEKWQQHLRDMHHKRMKTIRPEIDNKAPPRFVHLAQVRVPGAIVYVPSNVGFAAHPTPPPLPFQNLKRQQLDEERYSSIERANYLLLERMSHIMTHPQTVDMKQPLPPPKSLNKDGRKKELMRITEENHNILRRIQVQTLPSCSCVPCLHCSSLRLILSSPAQGALLLTARMG